DSVRLVGGNSSDFTFASFPGSSVPPGFATTFDVTFDPSTSGPHQTSIRITSSDPDEDTYDFAIRGLGTSLAPELTLRGNGMVIENGDDSPSLDDHTRFEGIRVESGRTSRIYTIENTGNVELSLNAIETTGGNASDFSVAESPAA
ncbi:MAG: choice-of-anchor D domain-containing protein, partial [Akkermansiaceae bacterium]|nr:choice-of-anchor D domain-containing protein [Akkermansiaceae bacterium]